MVYLAIYTQPAINTLFEDKGESQYILPVAYSIKAGLALLFVTIIVCIDTLGNGKPFII